MRVGPRVLIVAADLDARVCSSPLQGTETGSEQAAAQAVEDDVNMFSSQGGSVRFRMGRI